MIAVTVAVPVPWLGPLTYRLAPDQTLPPRGARVLVPLGSRLVTGCVLGAAGEVPPDRVASLKDVRAVLDTEPFLPGTVLDLASWAAEYYAAGPGETIAAAMPPFALRDPVQGRASRFRTVRCARLTPEGRDALGAPGSLTPRQVAALGVLAGAPGPRDFAALQADGAAPDTLTRLARRGLVEITRERQDRDPLAGASWPVDPAAAAGARTLTTEQAEALARLRAFADEGLFRVSLLHGVTGSGKTEIYLRLAGHVLERGRRVLVMVPEIALTPAVASLFRQAFGARVAIQHSALSDGERHDQWQRIRAGAVDIVVGTRSAVFTPLEGTGLVIVDEEHDTSYKQEEAPRYNGRDLAIVRARMEQALVVLGSATPSLESYHNALQGRYDRIVLARRVLDRPLAAVRIVNMRHEMAEQGAEVVLSASLVAALEARISRGEQALLLLNRRGFARALLCRQCGATLECPNCSVSLTIHADRRGPSRARCHYCNHAAAVPATCARCAAPYIELVGFGTERIDAEVRRMLPGARVARVDRDTMQRRGAIQSVLARFAQGEIDIIVGTQMIAKGHDFPAVTLVGVISADVGLGQPDFRAAERTFQLLTQVAGRAGRGDKAGEAIVQTFFPEHYSIQLACRQDYTAFFDEEIRFRRAMHYPPVLGLVNAVVKARGYGQAMDDATDLAARLRAEAADRGFRVLGPAPAPLGRLKGEYRVQLLLKGSNRPMMREALLRAIGSSPELQRRVTVDVDPISML